MPRGFFSTNAHKPSGLKKFNANSSFEPDKHHCTEATEPIHTNFLAKHILLSILLLNINGVIKTDYRKFLQQRSTK